MSQHRRLRQAAEALNIGQSTFSRRLHAIERQLDVYLVNPDDEVGLQVRHSLPTDL